MALKRMEDKGEVVKASSAVCINVLSASAACLCPCCGRDPAAANCPLAGPACGSALSSFLKSWRDGPALSGACLCASSLAAHDSACTSAQHVPRACPLLLAAGLCDVLAGTLHPFPPCGRSRTLPLGCPNLPPASRLSPHFTPSIHRPVSLMGGQLTACMMWPQGSRPVAFDCVPRPASPHPAPTTPSTLAGQGQLQAERSG